MRQKMTLSGRKELEQALGETYREAGLAEKQKILDSFVKATGYGRKYAMKLLNRTEERPVSKKKGRHSVYGNDVVEALATIWEKADFICSKRLVPFLPVMVEALERHGHLQLEASTKESLLKLSTATMDRLLKPQRTQMGKWRHYIKSQPGLLRELVTVRQRHFNGLDPVALQDKIQYAKKRLKERTDSPSSKALVDSKPCQTKKGRPRGSRNKDRDILLKRVAEIMCNDPAIGPKRLGEALVGCKPMHRRTLARLIDQWREAYPELDGEVTQS